MAVDETLMCSFKRIKAAVKQKKITASGTKKIG